MFCNQFYGSPAPRIDVPNDTHISGTFLMYQKFLKSRNLLIMFCTNNAYSTHFVGNEISNDDWKVLAEVIEVLHGTTLNIKKLLYIKYKKNRNFSFFLFNFAILYSEYILVQTTCTRTQFKLHNVTGTSI